MAHVVWSSSYTLRSYSIRHSGCPYRRRLGRGTLRDSTSRATSCCSGQYRRIDGCQSHRALYGSILHGFEYDSGLLTSGILFLPYCLVAGPALAEYEYAQRGTSTRLVTHALGVGTLGHIGPYNRSIIHCRTTGANLEWNSTAIAAVSAAVVLINPTGFLTGNTYASAKK